jgi:hypothetical protein
VVAGWFDRARLIWQHYRARRYALIWSTVRVPVAFLVAPISAPIVIMLLVSPVLFQSPGSFLQNLESLFQVPSRGW